MKPITRNRKKKGKKEKLKMMMTKLRNVKLN